MNYILDHIWGAMASLAGCIACFMTWLNGQKLKAEGNANLGGRLETLEKWQSTKSIDRVEFDDVRMRLTRTETQYEGISKAVAGIETSIVRLEGKLETSSTLSNLADVDMRRRLDDVLAFLKSGKDR